MMEKKNIVVKIDSELHYELKKLLLEKRISIQEYMIGLIKKDFEKEGIAWKENTSN